MFDTRNLYEIGLFGKILAYIDEMISKIIESEYIPIR